MLKRAQGEMEMKWRKLNNNTIRKVGENLNVGRTKMNDTSLAKNMKNKYMKGTCRNCRTL